jgi:UDP-GlcNAc:undecaprenyl-phosphate GlcNAc-1-phosphate transferase
VKTYAIVTVCAFAVAAVLTPSVRWLALRLGATDGWDGRKVHRRPVPRIGGIAIVAATLGPLAALLLHDNAVSAALARTSLHAVGLLGSGLLVAAVGLYDDLHGLGARGKLAGETIAALCLWVCGYQVHAIANPFGGPPLELGVFALPLTVLWCVGITNAVNLLDGLDGLAAGVGTVATVGVFVLASSAGAVVVCVCAAALTGALLGFLLYNFNPARIFMGDSGAMFVGFVLAACSIAGGSKDSVAVALLVPVVVMGLPILDTALAIVRRFARRVPVFSADREHLHHKLLDMGLTHRHAVLVLWGVSCVFLLLGLGLHTRHGWLSVASIVSLVVLVGATVRFFGYTHFMPWSKSSPGTEAPRRQLLDNLQIAVPTLCAVDADSGSAWERVCAFAAAAQLEELEVTLSTPRAPRAAPERTYHWRHACAPVPGPAAAPAGKRRPSPLPLASVVVDLGCGVAGTLRACWRAADCQPRPEEQAALRVVAAMVGGVLAVPAGSAGYGTTGTPGDARRAS